MSAHASPLIKIDPGYDGQPRATTAWGTVCRPSSPCTAAGSGSGDLSTLRPILRRAAAQHAARRVAHGQIRVLRVPPDEGVDERAQRNDSKPASAGGVERPGDERGAEAAALNAADRPPSAGTRRPGRIRARGRRARPRGRRRPAP